MAMKPVALLLAPFALPLATVVALIAALGAAATPARAQQQETLRIAAVVNDEVISLLDVHSRSRLLLLTVNQPETPENYRQAFPQVLRTLIDEKLELQEAKAKGIEVTDSDVDSMVAEIEQANRMAAGGLFRALEANQIPKDTMIAQIRARIAWQRTVARRLRLTYTVTGDQIDEALAQMKENQGKPEYLVAEISLGIDTPDGEPEVRRNAERMVAEIKQGADFAALARQFSEGASAASGGDLGWLQLNQLDPEIAEAVDHMQVGQVAGPLRTVGGFHILWLRERRTLSAPNPADIRVSLRRILVPVAANAPDLEAKREQATQAAQSIKSCEDVARVAGELGAGAPTDLGMIKLADLAPRLQPVVADLPAGKASPPLMLDNGLVIMVVCERNDPAGAAVPDRDTVAQRILADKLDGESRKYLRDLRQAAYIDIRA
jgi:peptidyl-prolyl cis-trans isomerase SurA